MKVVLFNGSPRKKGNTYHSLNVIIEQLEAAGIECEYMWIGAEDLHGCKSCYRCAQLKKCSQEDDKLNEYYEKMLDADGIILGSPTYFANIPSVMKALIDRAGLISKLGGNTLKRKLGAAVVAVRRAGATHVFSGINYFFLINEMIVVGSSYWNLAIGLNPKDVLKDEEGMATMKTLGENFAWTLKKLKS